MPEIAAYYDPQGVLREIDGERSIDDVYREIEALLERAAGA